MKKILIALVAIFALTQCKPANEIPSQNQEFLTEATNYGAYSGTNPVCVYDIDKHQTAVKKSPKYQFVMQSDDQSQYLVVTMNSMPEVLNTSIEVNVDAVGVKDFKNGVRTMTILKVAEGKAWFWSEQDLLGLVVAVPVN